jgi:hypothetical protein
MARLRGFRDITISFSLIRAFCFIAWIDGFAVCFRCIIALSIAGDITRTVGAGHYAKCKTVSVTQSK